MANGKTLTTIIDIAGRVDKSLGSSVNTALKLIDNLTVGVDKLMGNITSAIGVGGLAGIGVGIFAAVEAGKAFYNFMDEATQKAIDFEDEYADVVKVTDGMRDSFGNYTDMYYDARKDLFNIASNLPIENMTELTDAMAAVAQDGTLQYEEYAKAVNDAAKASIALDVPMEDSAKYLSTFRLNLHMSEDEAYAFANSLNYLGEESGRKPAELAEMASALSGVTYFAGLSANQTAALAAAIPGIDSAKAATSLKNFMIALEKGESATKRQKDALKSLGFEAGDFAKKVREDPIAALNEFSKAFNAANEDQQIAILNDFGGQRALEGLSILLGNFEQYQKMYADLEAGYQVGSIDREVESRKNTVKGLKQMLQNDWDTFQIEIGDKVLPAYKEVYNAEKFTLDFLKEDAIDLADAISIGVGSMKDLDIVKTAIMTEVFYLDAMLQGGKRTVNFLTGTVFPTYNAIFIGIRNGIGGAMNWLDKLSNSTKNILRIDFKKSILFSSLDLFGLKIGQIANLFDMAVSAAKRLAGVSLSGMKDAAINAGNSMVAKAAATASKNSFSTSPRGTKTPRQFASGGFASEASIFGEAGLEAAISFDPRYRERNIGIWTQAGQMLGTLSDNPLGGSGNGDSGVSVSVGNVTYEIIVHEGTKENVVKALRESEPEFADMLIDTIIRYKRGAYVGSSI